MQGWLCDTSSRIYISFNIWTSDNGYAIIGVYTHFVSGYAFTVKSVLLALRRIEETHAGEEVALILIDVVKFWQLQDRLGVFVSDNTDVNDITINGVLEALRPDIRDS